jgi:hypothetical protein
MIGLAGYISRARALEKQGKLDEAFKELNRAVGFLRATHIIGRGLNALKTRLNKEMGRLVAVEYRRVYLPEHAKAREPKYLKGGWPSQARFNNNPSRRRGRRRGKK